jgi:hypothetical protein
MPNKLKGDAPLIATATSRCWLRVSNFTKALYALTATIAPAALSSAQGPTGPNAFDGNYIGRASISGGIFGAGACIGMDSIDMTITGGQVVVHETYVTGLKLTLRGTVNSAGELSATRLPRGRVFGTIHDMVFTGERGSSNYCYYTVEMRKR